ncbi:indole-3-glycerol-phosphate synthase [Desulfovibrio mangrovi]|uniref:indole-3-glycerol-phosphate synthase n=1 Tax=Desulfovibrio mangrovi TaxID=2976983 RepID=UPI002246A649|nr:indole-3-glycerol-phosphate synthase [Desulfovibrio mangrovi]UZP66963.1 indole-3-glycerol-phosphate synthase [Desulfovibrio mangrovi]
MLERFRIAKAEEIRTLESLSAQKAMPAPFAGSRPSFSAALKKEGLAAICEYKRASPSKGEIEMGLSPEEVARQYQEGGAAALSVLTEEVYFKGDLGFLDRMTFTGLPLLRKDFLFHPLQIARTAATPASALLLIVRMFDDAALLRELLDMTHAMGMEAVVEVFDERDLDMAREVGSRIIQVNNRNLDTLQTDLAICERLVQDRSRAEVWIAASGISTPEHRRYVESLGYDAMLVGTALMQGGAPRKALEALLA